LILSISASQVARIAGMSHWSLDQNLFNSIQSHLSIFALVSWAIRVLFRKLWPMPILLFDWSIEYPIKRHSIN
jgi:hypothetical protein